MKKKDKKALSNSLESIEQQLIAKQKFLDAIKQLNAYVEFEGKSQEQKTAIIKNLDKVLKLSHAIYASAQATSAEKIKACELCQTIYLARSILYRRKLEVESGSISPELWNRTIDAANFYSTAIIHEGMRQIVENILTSVSEKVQKKEEEARQEKQERERLAKTFFDQGNNAFMQKDFRSAMTSYQEVIKLDQNFVQAHFNLARCHKRLGEQLRQRNNCATRVALLGSGQAAEVIFITTSEEKSFYEQAEICFEEGLRLLGKASAEAVIYREIGHLKELLGDFSVGVQYYQKASEIEKKDFYAFYINLIREEFDKKLLQVFFRYAYVFKDRDFIRYLNEKKGPNALFGFYLDCGSFYYGLDQIDPEKKLNADGKFLKKCLVNSAIQHFLLATQCKVSDQIKINNVYKDYLHILEGRLDACVFDNLFNLLSQEKLQDIKRAFVLWIKYDLAIQNYASAIKKFELIGGDQTNHQLMSAEFFYKMSQAYQSVKDLEVVILCLEACLERDKDYQDAPARLQNFIRLREVRLMGKNDINVSSLQNSFVLHSPVQNGHSVQVQNSHCNSV